MWNSFSKNIHRSLQDGLGDVLGVKRVEKHEKFLGLPMETGESKADAIQYLNERNRKRTQGWRDKFLSTSGKEVLIKLVIQSIPTYVMSCFELPQYLCDEMHKSMARFWWGDQNDTRKIHWMSWEGMCSPKGEGGLGFRDMRLFNKALLAKQGWRLVRQPNSLLARALKAKYHPHKDFMKAQTKKGASLTWRRIIKGRDTTRKTHILTDFI